VLERRNRQARACAPLVTVGCCVVRGMLAGRRLFAAWLTFLNGCGVSSARALAQAYQSRRRRASRVSFTVRCR